jgi:hypothetical protein
VIFKHYVEQAHQRRSNDVSAEIRKQKELLRQANVPESDKIAVATVISQEKLQNLAALKNMVTTQRDVISYKEYLQVRLCCCFVCCIVVGNRHRSQCFDCLFSVSLWGLEIRKCLHFYSYYILLACFVCPAAFRH